MSCSNSKLNKTKNSELKATYEQILYRPETLGAFKCAFILCIFFNWIYFTQLEFTVANRTGQSAYHFLRGMFGDEEAAKIKLPTPRSPNFKLRVSALSNLPKILNHYYEVSIKPNFLKLFCYNCMEPLKSWNKIIYFYFRPFFAYPFKLNLW